MLQIDRKKLFVYMIVACLSSACAQDQREIIYHDADVEADSFADADTIDSDVVVDDADVDADQVVCDGQVWCQVEWVEVYARSFYSGTFDDEPGRDSDETRRWILLSVSYEIQTTEVTQEQFFRLMDYDPTIETACAGNCPVGNVSWHEAAAYTNALSHERGIEQCYVCEGAESEIRCTASNLSWGTMIQQCSGYRLPTEIEWEFAARGGHLANPLIFDQPEYSEETLGFPYHLTNDTLRDEQPNRALDEYTWFNGNSGRQAHPVATKAPNALGLFDVLGNRWEATNDWYGPYPTASDYDYSGSSSGTEKVYRGGSAHVYAESCRFSDRSPRDPQVQQTALGMRVVRTLSE